MEEELRRELKLIKHIVSPPPTAPGDAGDWTVNIDEAIECLEDFKTMAWGSHFKLFEAIMHLTKDLGNKGRFAFAAELISILEKVK